MGVTGIGGVFIRAKDPEGLAAWYKKHLGMYDMDANYDPWPQQGPTVFKPIALDDEYFGEKSQMFMLNLRVDNLDEVLGELKSNDVKVLKEIEVQEGVGRFASIEDPEGNRIELWEPSD